MFISFRRRHQIDLVPDDPGENCARERRCSRLSITVFRIFHPQNQVGVRRSLPRAANTLLLDRIVALANARGVEQRHRIAVRDRDAPRSRRASCRRSGDTIAASRRAMRLSSVDLPAFGGPAIATTSPSRSRSPRARPASACRNLVAQLARDLQRRPDQVLRHIGLVGKIDPRLDQRQRLDQPRAPALGAVAEQALQLPKRLPALRLGFGADQIGQPLDRGEIELAVLEGAAGELARLGRPQARRCAPSAPSIAAMTARPPCNCSSTTSSPVSLFGPGNHSASASSMISPDAGSRTRASAGLARLRHSSRQRLERIAGARAGDPHDRDRRRRPAGGQGEDGVARCAGHFPHRSASRGSRSRAVCRAGERARLRSRTRWLHAGLHALRKN